MFDSNEDEATVGKEEMAKLMPAARCRECSAVTWTVSIANGLSKEPADAHREKCSRPLGRLDLLDKLPLAMRPVLYGGRLQRPMTQEEVNEVAEDMGLGSS